MAATDVVTIGEAKLAISMSDSAVQHDAVLAQHITAVSDLLDDRVGPIVQRNVDAEVLDGMGGPTVHLRWWPVAGVAAVREFDGSVASLSRVSFGESGDGYRLDVLDAPEPDLFTGALHRVRAGFASTWPCGGGNVEVSYLAGRVADTSSVPARFKDCAGAILRRLWKREAGTWAQSSTFLEDQDASPSPGFFKVADPIIAEQLRRDVHLNSGFA